MHAVLLAAVLVAAAADAPPPPRASAPTTAPPDPYADLLKPLTPPDPYADLLKPLTPPGPDADLLTPLTPTDPDADLLTPLTPTDPDADLLTPLTPPEIVRGRTGRELRRQQRERAEWKRLETENYNRNLNRQLEEARRREEEERRRRQCRPAVIAYKQVETPCGDYTFSFAGRIKSCASTFRRQAYTADPGTCGEPEVPEPDTVAPGPHVSVGMDAAQMSAVLRTRREAPASRTGGRPPAPSYAARPGPPSSSTPRPGSNPAGTPSPTSPPVAPQPAGTPTQDVGVVASPIPKARQGVAGLNRWRVRLVATEPAGGGLQLHYVLTNTDRVPLSLEAGSVTWWTQTANGRLVNASVHRADAPAGDPGLLPVPVPPGGEVALRTTLPLRADPRPPLIAQEGRVMASF